MSNLDEFIGSKFPTAKGFLTVKEKIKVLKNGIFRSEFICTCSHCSKDKKLWPYGSMAVPKGTLVKGLRPCSCSWNTSWSEAQNVVRVTRACESKGLIFYGWHGDYKGDSTRLRLCCERHSCCWNTTIVSNLLHKNRKNKNNCPCCEVDNLSLIKTKDYKAWVEDFIKAGFSNQHTFSRCNTDKAYWYYTCPTCSKDEYVIAGVCTGIFKSRGNDLIKGKRSCRCSSVYRWTKEQRELKIKQICYKECLTFLRWQQHERYTNKVKFHWLCKNGHNCETNPMEFIFKGRRCRQCNGGHIQRQAYINLLSDNKTPYCLKYGIAGEPKFRLKTQEYKSIFSVDSIGVWEFPSIDLCKRAEQVVSSCVEHPYASKWDFPDGYTETCGIRYIDRIIETYEEYGGTLQTHNLNGISIKQS